MMFQSILDDSIPHGMLVILHGERCFIYYAKGIWIVQTLTYVAPDKDYAESWFTVCSCED